MTRIYDSVTMARRDTPVIINQMSIQMQKLLICFSLAAALSACSIHRPPVQQGNVLDKEALAQLKPGLSKRQVKFILGDPVLVDPFHANRWDYVYWLKPKAENPTLKRLVIYFDNELVSRMESEGVEAPAAAPPETPGN